MVTDNESGNPEVTSPEQSAEESTSSQDPLWEPLEESDDDYEEEEEDEEDEEENEIDVSGDGVPLLDELEGGITEQLLQDFIDGGLFANLNAIINNFEDYGESEGEDEFGIEQLVSEGCSFHQALCPPAKCVEVS